VCSDGKRDLARRNAYITGHPPRIGPLRAEEIAPEVISEFNARRVAAGVAPIKKITDYVATMLKLPRLMDTHSQLALYFYSGELSPRIRELAILRVSWLCGAPYEWGEHVAIAKRIGITSPEIDAVREGPKATSWEQNDRTLMRAVDELAVDAMITDETWAGLARFLGERELIEFPLLIGQYQGYAYLQNSLRMRLQDGNPGFDAR
jgi:alkylhydroperoxidase family enzyme